ncbi:MAG: hypothetical protein NC218_07885 [Acetobacter sp.]|nr:hypothetical protein [Acetobacter sp.]
MTNGVAIRGMTVEESMVLFLLICHRSERSEVKRSRESIVWYLFMDCAATENGVFLLARTTKRCCGRSSLATLREVCHALVPYGCARNDGALGAGDPLTNGVAIRGMT